MEFERLYAPTLKELFIQQLQGRILSGDLPQGTRLPPVLPEPGEDMRFSRNTCFCRSSWRRAWAWASLLANTLCLISITRTSSIETLRSFLVQPVYSDGYSIKLSNTSVNEVSHFLRFILEISLEFRQNIW